MRSHLKAHALKHESANFHVDSTRYNEVPYTESYIKYYKCSCGQTKSA